MVWNSKKKFKVTQSAITSNELATAQSTLSNKISTTSTNLVSNAETNYLNTTGDTMDGVLSIGLSSYLQFADNSIQLIPHILVVGFYSIFKAEKFISKSFTI